MHVWQDCVTTEHTEWQCPVSDVHSTMMVKSAQPGKGGVARPTPFTLSTITSKVVVYAPAKRADTLLLYPFMYLWRWLRKRAHYQLIHPFFKNSNQKNPQKSVWGGGAGTVYLLAVQIPAVPNNWVKLRIKDSCCGKLLLLLSPAHFCTGIGFKYILYVLTMHIHTLFIQAFTFTFNREFVYCYLLVEMRERSFLLMLFCSRIETLHIFNRELTEFCWVRTLS